MRRRREAKITTKYRFNRPTKTLSHSWGLTSESLIRGRIIIINYSVPFQANVEKIIILKFTFIIIILERTVLSFIGRIHRIKINISLLAFILFVRRADKGAMRKSKTSRNERPEETEKFLVTSTRVSYRLCTHSHAYCALMSQCAYLS